MKTPEEILSEKTGYSVSELIERKTEPILQPFDCLEAIRQTQKEAIEETARRCAESAKMMIIYYPVTSTTTRPSEIKNALLDEHSILQVADGLKKELGL